MMRYLSELQSIDKNTATNRFLYVVFSLFFLYAAITALWGKKIAWRLLCADKYQKKQTKVRLYGLIQTGIIETLFILAIVYCSVYKIWHLAAFFGFILLGYTWITFQVYSSRVEYTNSYLRIYLCKRLMNVVPFSNIKKMDWLVGRGRIMMELVIFCNTGEKITLSSANFVGLVKLRATYEKWKPKQKGKGNIPDY